MNEFGVLGCLRGRARLLTILTAVTIQTFEPNALASDATLAWDPASDPTVLGYNVYIGGASRSYTNVVNVGDATSLTISNLTPGVTYYFAATTYTVSGIESEYSAEAVYTPQAIVQNYQPTLDPIGDVTINENVDWH